MNNTTSNQLIKLAYDRPELRDAIMPRILLAKGLAKTPEAAKNMWEKYKEKNPGTRKQPADFYEKPEEGEARKEKSDKEKSKADKGKEKNESRQKDQKKKVLKKIYEKDRKRINEEIKNMDSEELQSAIKQLISDQRSHGFGPAKSKHPEDSPEYALEKVKASPYSGEEYKYYAQALVSKNKKETSKKQTERNEAAKEQKKTNRTKKVNDLASKHGISPEGLKKLKSFTKKRNNKLRKDKAEADMDYDKDAYRKTQKAKSTAELKREFMNNTDPETRKRILKMSPAEFEAMMAAIMEEEDGKQASLRTKLIRLAHAKPELREKILPLIKQADEGEEEAKAGPSKRPGGKFIQFMKEMGDEKVRNPDTGNDVKLKSLKGERGKKLQKEKFDKWLASQEKSKSEDKGSKPPAKSEEAEDKGSDKPSGSGGKSNPLKPIDVDFPALHKIVGKENTNYVVRWFSDGETADTSSADAFRNVIKDKVIKGFGDELERSSRGQKVLKKLDSLSDDELAQVEHAIFGKKASLRSSLIRLAHEKPELRSKILPLLNQKTARRLPDLDYMIPVAKENGAKEENFANGMIRAWRWETEFEENGRTFTKYHLLMGTASKRARRATVWEYHTNAASRDRKVKEIVASFERRAKEKAQRREEAKNFQHGYQVGDILVSVWGYDQTNVEFYQVTELIGSKSIEIQMVSSKVVKESRGSEMVVPIKDRFIRSEKPLRKKVDTRRAVKLNSYSYARPWSGKPISQTSSYAGH